ncbi:MAG TPA: NAD(P)-dependent oxidoreductase [Candidatus Limnocylindria bacterium]|jgi:dTDP-6-deoxy-L-talose 4-dehydrogenase (NAD+)|nr:NAD(P)-dependent oxidoreductase [Candidatus Limnocylindria bacterium]
MRVLVTGGTGFLGREFVRAADAHGHSLAVLSRQERSFGGANIRFLPGSLAEPPWKLIEAFAPEACVHSAWIATPGVYLESPENEAWVDWSRGFIGRLAQCGLRHATVLGTCIEYQITGDKLHEVATPLAPVSRYARSKVRLFQELAAMPATSPISLAWARIFYPYGEGEHPARLASSLVAKMAAGESVFLKTPRSIKDYIHSEDVGRALLKIMESQVVGAVNVGTGEGVMIESLARKIADLLGRPELIQTPAQPVSDPLDFVVADASKLLGLGWKPQVELDEGLRRLVEARRR